MTWRDVGPAIIRAAMAALLWLALVAVALVYLFIRSRTRHAPAAAAPAPAKAPAQAEPIAPAAEELRRRRAALLDRAAQTAPTAPTPPPPVKPLNLRALTEAQIVTPTPAPPPPKSVAADAPPPAQPFPARTPSPLPVSAASPPKPPAPVALPSLETFLAQVLRVTLNPPLSLSASSGTGLLRMLYLPASGAELKDKELASLEPAQIDALVAEAQALLDGALRLPFVLSAFAQLERRALPAAVALPWRRALAAQMAILLLEAPQSIASSPRPKCALTHTHAHTCAAYASAYTDQKNWIMCFCTPRASRSLSAPAATCRSRSSSRRCWRRRRFPSRPSPSRWWSSRWGRRSAPPCSPRFGSASAPSCTAARSATAPSPRRLLYAPPRPAGALPHSTQALQRLVSCPLLCASVRLLSDTCAHSALLTAPPPARR